ncbi:MAG: MFS transporter [Thermoanaerobaculia bacterium]|nr:MFS transporter [Thermoanaerobaculia bacterium]
MGTGHDSYAALRVAPFRSLIVNRFCLTLALQIQAVVVGWQVYERTRDPLALGFIGLAEALPFIGLALFAGHVADRKDRRRIALLSHCALLLCALALFVLALRPDAFAPDAVWPIYAVIFASGIARSFTSPAVIALSAQLVPRELYGNAIAWRTSTWQIGAVAGPAVGGLLYGFGSARLAYGVDAALIAVAIAFLWSIPSVARTTAPVAQPIGDSLTSGLRFVFRQRLVLGAMTLDLFSVLFGGAVALLPIFASDILQVGPQGLGILRAAPAMGSALMGVYLAHRPPFKRAGAALFLCVALFGVSMIGFALSRNFLLSIFFLAFSGMVDNVSIVVRSTLLQTLTPEEMLGRVSAVNQIFIGSSNEIGAFESGVAASLLGTVPSVVFGGAMTLLIVAITAWRIPELLRLREIRA